MCVCVKGNLIFSRILVFVAFCQSNWYATFCHSYLPCLFFFPPREQLLKANFDSPPISPKMTASAVKCRAASEKGHNSSGTILSHFFQKRHRAPPSKETHQDVQLGGVRTAKTHKENDADLHPGKDYTTACIKEEPADEEITFTPGLMSVKSEVTASQSINAGFEMAHSSTPSKDVKPIIKGEVNLQLCF